MSESLKIAFYTDTFLPAVDGVVISILNFKRELEKRGHEVYVYASGTGKTRQMAGKYKNIVVVRGVSFRRYPQYSVALFPLGSRLRTMNLRMDINHAHTPFMMGMHALLLSKFDKTPVVGSFHTLFTDRSVIREYVVGNRRVTNTIIKYSWKYARLFYNKCDGVAAPSDAIRRMLNGKGIRNVDVIANGVDIRKFNPEVSGYTIRKRFAKGDEKLVMYVGRISKEKRLETLIKAAGALKKERIRFAIVGAGPAQEHYQSMVERMHLQDRIKFAGFIDNSELPRYYAACDAFCIPSTFETQGVVSLEAMASGKPVIGADYLALRDVIKDGKNGEKFRPNDSMDCAKKIKKVINNIDSYKEMRITAKRYSIENTTTDLLDLYRRILNNESS
ncbi:MAG: glycosyltransferase [Candidatus Micrarchaeota archaeon]|nr:glycosyltransferase [Candidatus Micrarchaeota archaeon]